MPASFRLAEGMLNLFAVGSGQTASGRWSPRPTSSAAHTPPVSTQAAMATFTAGSIIIANYRTPPDEHFTRSCGNRRPWNNSRRLLPSLAKIPRTAIIPPLASFPACVSAHRQPKAVRTARIRPRRR